MPREVDSNSPAFWKNGELYLFNSTGSGPLLSRGADQFSLGSSKLSTLYRPESAWPAWIEAVWLDPGGAIFAWYHQEHEYICGPQRPAQPRIGAAVSYDGGRTFQDLGIVLASGDAVNCGSLNGYFSGGHGDFTVVLDRDEKYFYFLFSNYGGPVESQGVVTARMAYQDRFRPIQMVWKYYRGAWDQPGIGGKLSPVFPVNVSWQSANADAFWGPSVHWNTHLETFVLLMNRSCCAPGWPQEGIYASFNVDLSHPESWAQPTKLDVEGPFWYPQVLGTGPGETDSVAGESARLYIFGESEWELIFHKSPPPEEPEQPQQPDEPVQPEEPGQPQEPDPPQEPESPQPEPPPAVLLLPRK